MGLSENNDPEASASLIKKMCSKVLVCTVEIKHSPPHLDLLMKEIISMKHAHMAGNYMVDIFS